MERTQLQENKRDLAVLVGLRSPVLHEDSADEESLAELSALVETAGGQSVGMILQSREKPDPHSFIGEGKVEEVKRMVENSEATMVIFDNDLSPSQMRVLTELLGVQVLDRCGLILDIFAQRAKTKEGRLQVELAQLRYRLARLTGKGIAMSRLGGGIGTRGPGEKKLEMDRRLIHERIGQLKSELEEVKRHRDVIRKQREKAHTPVAAIVGYTNAGKSTLLNALTGAGILAENKLFATLDPTTRRMELSSGQEILLTDTVGFIRKLPHHLVEAFKSTLEEARYADYILHVVDSVSPQMDAQMEAVYETLDRLGIAGRPVITLFNKRDLAAGSELPKDPNAVRTIGISAGTGAGLKELQEVLEEQLRNSRIQVEKLFPYAQAGDIQRIRRYGQVLEEEYREDGIYIKAWMPRNY